MFIINLVLGIFVSFAHIPLVALKLTGESGFESVNLWWVLLLIPFDLILLLGAIAALAGSDERKSEILLVHAIILGLLSALIVGKRAFYKGTNKFMANAGWYSAGIVFLFELVLMNKFYVVHFT